MRLETLIALFPQLRTTDCVVTFVDGDSYAIADLDFQGFQGDAFEIVADFDKCLAAPRAKEEALQKGYLRPDRTSWTSSVPHMPVGRCYRAEEIVRVFDRDRAFALYEAEGEANQAPDPTRLARPESGRTSSI